MLCSTGSHKIMNYANGKEMSQEEQRIWDELECEIEKDLEDEIKDGLLKLARQLQILYQHKKSRSVIDCEAAPDLSILIKLGISCVIDIKDGNLCDDRSKPCTPSSELCSKKKWDPDSSGISQSGSSQASLTVSKWGTVNCTSRPLRKKSKKGTVAWKY